MAVSDPIADLLTRIRNGLKAQLSFVSCRWSKIKEAICSILKSNGFIKDYQVLKDGHVITLRIVLKYGANRKGVIEGINRLSSPGCRRYVACTEIPYTRGGMGISILSTSRGLMTDAEARKNRVGGELLCKVW